MAAARDQVSIDRGAEGTDRRGCEKGAEVFWVAGYKNTYHGDTETRRKAFLKSRAQREIPIVILHSPRSGIAVIAISRSARDKDKS
jgi:hypothetical protein